MSPRVVARLVDKLADLHAWGRDPATGQWWGLISWAVYGQHHGGGNSHRYLSAWVPAGTLEPSRDDTLGPLYAAVERLDLPTNRAAWPTPAATHGRTWHHYGPITDSPALPDDVYPLAHRPPPLHETSTRPRGCARNHAS